jgi:UDPglucose--hexose-1-phosphate uridylyltransferase
MPELRQDPTTREWVIIAPERAGRPDQFRSTAIRPKQPVFDPACPFCPGNETTAPTEVLVRPSLAADSQAEWQVRVIRNKFPALTPDGIPEPRTEAGFFHRMDGFGYHEVIVETPVHNRPFPAMQQPEVEAVVRAYRDRYVALKEDARVQFILIFKNHGERAGASLTHPHSQLIATPVVPVNLRRKYEEAIHYYNRTGRCLYSDLLDAEQAAGERVIMGTPNYLVFHPFASHAPFETWILPKIFRPAFGQVTGKEMSELSEILIEVLGRFREVLNDPDYNLVIHSAPRRGEDEAFFLWHIRIVPRLTKMAGFEIGSGMRINIEKPENTARMLRRTAKV